MFLSNSEKMRSADNETIFDWGVDSLWLMENAAAAVAERAYEYCRGGSAVIFCGSGNNGGDGVAAAVWLMEKGVKCRVLLTGSRERLTRDTAEMCRRLENAGGTAEDYEPGMDISVPDVIIDAMFGIGLNKPVAGKAAAAIGWINASGAPVIAADIASGIEADTGRVLGCAVKAAETVTFSLAKVGQLSQPGNIFTGKLHIVDIGIPGDIVERAKINVRVLYRENVSLPRRDPLSHKGNHGKVLIIAGSADYCGAPNMCSNAAVRSGAGLVYLGVPKSIHAICAVKNTEAMPFALPEDEKGRVCLEAMNNIREKLKHCSVCVIGPGLGRSESVAALVKEIVETYSGRLVLDADALWAVGQDLAMLRRSGAEMILTPHEGEFAAMGGVLTGDRVGDALSFATEHGVTLLLKGHRSVLAYPDGEAVISTLGNAGMAKGGSGDVLAGILGGMLGQFGFKKAAETALWLHGRAGDICWDKYGEYAMTAGDMIAALPEATMEIMED